MRIILRPENTAVVLNSIMAMMDAAGGSTTKATFYHTAADQSAALAELVANGRAVSSELPLLVAVQPNIRASFIAEAVYAELSAGLSVEGVRVIDPHFWIDGRVVNDAIAAALKNISDSAGWAHVLRLFERLADGRVNNARTRRLVLRYLVADKSLEFHAVKYHAKYRKIFTHILGRDFARLLAVMAGNYADQDRPVDHTVMIKLMRHARYNGKPAVLAGILAYVFGLPFSADRYAGLGLNVMAQAVEARVDVFDKPLVPQEVLVGLISANDHPQHALWGKEFQTETRARLVVADQTRTATQKVRAARADKAAGVQASSAELVGADPIALLKAMFAGAMTNDQIDEAYLAAVKKATIANFPYKRIGVVLDVSQSMSGRGDARWEARARAQFANDVLAASARDSVVSTTAVDSGSFTATDLATAFLAVLRHKPDAVFVLSDGYENAPEGMLDRVLDRLRAAGDFVPVYHLSSTAAPENLGAARRISKSIDPMLGDIRIFDRNLRLNALKSDIRLWLTATLDRLFLESGSVEN